MPLTIVDQAPILTRAQQADYTRLAQARLRAMIPLVPGVGPIRGVFTNGVVVHAIRDEAPANPGDPSRVARMYRMRNNVWEEILPLLAVRFTHNTSSTRDWILPLGVAVHVQGRWRSNNDPTIIGAWFFGAPETVVVRAINYDRASRDHGMWGGTLLLEPSLPNDHPSSSPQGNFTTTLTNGTIVTDSNVDAHITQLIFTLGANQLVLDVESAGQDATRAEIFLLPAGGKWEILRHNFYGHAAGLRMYGANGQGPMFEFDGLRYAPLYTSLPPALDRPKFVTAFKSHLAFAVESSLFLSGVGNPHSVAANEGAVEFAFGDTITGIQEQPGESSTGSLAIYTQNRTEFLYGTDAASWQISTYNSETGAAPYSVQRLDDTYALDRRGVFSLNTSLAFGNFVQNSLTEHIHTWLYPRILSLVDSTVHGDKQQYRLLFSTGDALYLTLVNRKLVGAMPIRFPQAMSVVWHEGLFRERTFAGGTNGAVYELDRGTSFAGEPMQSRLELYPLFQHNLHHLKQYRRAELEIEGQSSFELCMQASYGYENEFPHNPGIFVSKSLTSQAFRWDDPAARWDDPSTQWDALPEGIITLPVRGKGRYLQLTLIDNSGVTPSYALRSLVVDFTPLDKRVRRYR